MNYVGKIAVPILLTFPFIIFASMSSASVVVPTSAFVASDTTQKQNVVSAFRQYVSVSPTISIPTVLEVPLSQDALAFPVLAMYNMVTNEFEPYLLNSAIKGDTPSQTEAKGATGSAYALNDGDYETYLEFPVRDGTNRAEITFAFVKPIVVSSLSFALDNYVALPQTISIQADTANGSYTVLAPSRLHQSNITFPKTTASVWHISFDYVQPLRIIEMKFNESSSGTLASRSVRFLAQPGQNYQIYFDADRYVRPVQKEVGDLSSNKGVVTVSGSRPVMNPSFTPSDSDDDTIPDLTDNCVSIANTDQKDSDANGRGDACEDYDRDSIVAAKDNCPNIPNQDQIDTDADEIGDSCDNFDNRVTERMPWLPWVGIGTAGVVLLGLSILVFRYKKDGVVSGVPGGPSA